MHFKTKINHRRYFPWSIGLTLLSLMLVRNSSEAIGIGVVYLATLINHLMLVEATTEMSLSGQDGRKSSGSKVAYLFIGKGLVLLIGLSLGVHFMGNRVVIAIINYVVQIFVLGTSVKNKGVS